MQQSHVSSAEPVTPDASTQNRNAAAPREPMWPAMGWWKHMIAVLVLAVIAAAVFSNSYRSGMTLDNKYIIEEYYKALLRADKNHDLTSWRQVQLIFQNDYWWPKGISGLYRPITTFTYWIDYVWLTGKAPKHDAEFKPIKDAQGNVIPEETWRNMSWYDYAYAPGLLNTNSYHTINLIMHWVNAVLIYFVSLCLIKRLWPAFFVAALFVAHPITTETVTNIIGRADQFAAICVFGGLLVYIRSTKSTWFWRTPWLILLMLFCAFGFFSKESSIAVGVIVPLYWLTFVFDWRRPQWWKPLLKELAVWCVMIPPLVGMLAARDWVFRNSSPPETPFLDNPIRGIWMVRELGLESFEEELKKKPMEGMTFVECKMTAVKILGKLTLLVAWPWTLSSDYSWDEIPNFTFKFIHGTEDLKAILALIGMLGTGALTFWLYWRGHKTAFFYIWFYFFAALPTSNLIVTIGSVMAERFMYLPLAGFTGILVLGVFELARRAAGWLKFEDPDDIRRFKVLAGSFLSLVIMVYGVRAFVRNYVWESDITLWEAAIKDSPRAFRCYQSLAFAYYEQNPVGNIDKMIRIAEGARPIVDPLPNHLNSSRLYLHLGMYYSIKGELLSRRDPKNGSFDVTPEAAGWFHKAIEVLEKGSEIDRSFNEVNKAKQKRRGDEPHEISDAGLGPVYGTLGLAYARLGDYQSALERFEYQRQLDPTDIDAYVKLASVQLAQGKLDTAAITVIQCILMDGSRNEFWATLSQIYGAYGQQGAGAIIPESGQPKLNLNHPMVRDHLCQAYREFIKVFRRAHRWSMAEAARKAAVEQYGFPANLFDPLFKEPIYVVTPQGIQIGQLSPASPGPDPATIASQQK